MFQNKTLRSQRQRIDDVISRTATASGGSLELQAHWAKYVCVLVTGFLEVALQEMYRDFARAAGSPPVANYVIIVLGHIRNPNSPRFLEIAKRFNPSWAVELENYLAEDGRKEAIDSLMANRHNIAHGKQSGVTLAQVKEWWEKSLDVLEFIEAQCSI